MKRLVKTVLLGLAASAATASWAADHYWYGKSTSDVTQAEWNDGIGTWSSDVYFITEKDLKDGAASVTTLDFSNIDQDTVVKKFCVANGLDDERVVTFTGGAKFDELHVGYWGSSAEYSGRLVLDGAYTTGYLEIGPWFKQSYAITGMVEVARSSSLAVNGNTKMGTSTQGVGVLVVKGDMDSNGTLTAGSAAGGKGFVVVDGGTLDVTGELQLADNDDTEAKMTITNATVTASSWVCIGRNGARRTAVCTVDNGGYILHTVDSASTGLFCIGNLGGDDSHNELIVNEGGRVHTYGNVRVGESGSAILTMNGGTFRAATASGGMRYIIMNSANTAYDTTINLNGGVIECGRITTGGSGTGSAKLNFNGGTLRAVAANTIIPDQSDLTVTVGDNGGTIDTAGFDLTVETKIEGSGVLTVTGGGSVTFTERPTCDVVAEDGTRVTLFYSIGEVPSAVSLGVGEFMRFDLSSETEADKEVELAENVSITTTDSSPVVEHIVIKNSSGLYWNISYEGNKLTATSFAASSYTQAATGDFTIFTGYYNADYPTDQVESWVNGFPTKETMVIAASAVMKMYGNTNVHCDNFQMFGDLTIEGKVKYRNFRPHTVTGAGTLTFTTGTDTFGYLEANNDDGYPCTINVPVILAGQARVSSYPNNLLTFNRAVTIAANADVDDNNGGVSSVFADDLTVNGTYRSGYTTEIASGKTLSGVGTLDGSLELNGIVAPGTNTAETLTVTGAATFNSGSSLLVTIGEDGASSCLALTGEGTVDVANISVDVANKSALVRNSGYEYTVMTAENGILTGRRRGGVKASDGSFWRAKISSDAKSLVLVHSFGGLSVFVR